MTPRRIDRYWGDFFGLAAEEILAPGTRVLPHAGLGDYRGAWIFQRGPTILISVPPERVAETAARLGAISREDPLTEAEGPLPAAARALFGDAVERVIGPAFQGTLEPEEFRPVPSPHVRRLLPGDQPALAALQAACDPVEWAYSNLDPDATELFGFFDGDTLAAACRNVLRAPDAADHGVLTHPAYRGRGCGKAVVSASIQHALDRGRLILYQTLVANTAAVGIARALGCREYARHLAVRLRF